MYFLIDSNESRVREVEVKLFNPVFCWVETIQHKVSALKQVSKRIYRTSHACLSIRGISLFHVVSGGFHFSVGSSSQKRENPT